jgi:hypothetical protein
VWELQFSYADLPQVMKSLKAYPCNILTQELSEIGQISVSIPMSQERLMSELVGFKINP